jgi:hypothetical protein
MSQNKVLKKINSNTKHIISILSLSLIAVLAYWQVAFNKNILTHDFLNCWLPWRYYLSQCIQNGIFPYWNPYQQLGYPIHADLQGPAWYIESLFFSMLTEQNPVSLQYLFVSYIALAGIGMYSLSFYLQKSKKVAWCIGLAYMLSGFFVAHSQHFYAIISAAWLPFIILNYLRLLQLGKLKYGIYTAVFLFFTITGGNHTFLFFTIYLFIPITIYFLFQSYKTSIASFWLMIKHLFITLFLTIAQVMVVIVVFIQVQPFISRLNGLDYESCAVFPFTWESFISFFQPFATTVEWDYYQTDPSMSNSYLGWFLLPFCLLFLFRKKTVLELVLAFFALFCLIMSFGDATPLYKWMFHFLPGINLFRFTSYFIFMFSFILLLLIGNTMSLIQQQFEQYRTLLINVFAFLGASLFFKVITSFYESHFQAFTGHFFNLPLVERTLYGTRFDHIALQGALQLILFVILIFIFLKRNQWLTYGFMFIMALDLIISVQLNVGNVCVGKESPKTLTKYLNSLPSDFPRPSDEPIVNFSEERGQKSGLYRNTAVYHKWVSEAYHNSFVFSGKTFLYSEKPELYQAIISNRLFYLSNAIFPMKEIDKKVAKEKLKLSVFFDSQDFIALSKNIVKCDSTVAGNVQLLDVKPNNLKALVTCNSNTMLHCIQSYYSGWKAFIDGKETQIYKSNGLTMSLLVPKGKHMVSLQYTNTAAKMAGISGYSVFFILLIYISFMNRNHPLFRYFFIGIWVIGTFIILRYLFMIL